VSAGCKDLRPIADGRFSALWRSINNATRYISTGLATYRVTVASASAAAAARRQQSNCFEWWTVDASRCLTGLFTHSFGRSVPQSPPASASRPVLLPFSRPSLVDAVGVRYVQNLGNGASDSANFDYSCSTSKRIKTTQSFSIRQTCNVSAHLYYFYCWYCLVYYVHRWWRWCQHQQFPKCLKMAEISIFVYRKSTMALYNRKIY